MELLKRGIAANIILLDDEQKFITYPIVGKRYRYTDPEEEVRATTYLQLIFDYGYDARRIDVEHVVPRRTPSDLADIVVFSDERRKEPWIVIECKRQVISDAEFTQAIEQGFGNANSLSAPYLMVTSGLKTQYYDVKNFPSLEREANRIADIPRFNEYAPKKYKYTKGGVFDIVRVEEQQLTRIFKQAHDALWAGGKRNPAEAFDELDKLIFCKLWDERSDRKIGDPYDFQVFTGEPPEDLLNRLKNLYSKGKVKDPEVFKEDIRLNAREVQRIVGYLAPVNLGDTDLDSKGRAFETFMGSFFRGEFGQYFTPRTIVQFITQALPITNESLVLDPACGSGGFLLHALDKVRRQADRMAKESYFAKESLKHYNHWHDFAEHNLFGIEISETIARTAKMNMIIHDDGHTNVVSHDGLEHTDKIRSNTRNNGFKENHFNFIVTNPPFGSSIKASEHRYIEDYQLGLTRLDWIEAKLRGLNDYLASPRNRQSSEVLFIEKCHRFLKTNGILAMVIPDGILTNLSSQYVRDWIEEHFRIVAVVSLPQTAFTATGAGVKSSVIFLQKYADETTLRIQSTKANVRSRIFDTPEFGFQIRQLENEKERAIKHGDMTIRHIEEDLVAHLDALRLQGTLDPATKKREQKAAMARIKEYKKTDAYREWLRETTDEYNERINNLKEAMQESAQEAVAIELDDYPILMAIAEHIGFDATGRQTGRNELEHIAGEILRFIEAIQLKQDSYFSFNPDLNEERFFILNRKELNGRLDAYFYLPFFLQLEDTIKKQTARRLRDFIQELAGGATPSREEDTIHYTTKEFGIPFLRVQNITEEGLKLDDVKYITLDTHHKLLKRSQVFEDNLLVTITGRIASAAVAPKGFEGNINQHSVVIKTDGRSTSEYLAAYLNSNIGQKLAQRRTTGGTRPALDYRALRSIPVVVKPMISTMTQEAIALKKQREAEAKAEFEQTKQEIERILLGEQA
jgi:type I restriction enzyme M protein